MQKAAGLVGGVEEVERDEVMDIRLGATVTIDITAVMVEAVTIDDVAIVTAVTVMVIAIFPVSNFPRSTPTFIHVSYVGINVISFIFSHVAAVAAVVSVAPAAGVDVSSFAADVKAVFTAVVVLWI